MLPLILKNRLSPSIAPKLIVLVAICAALIARTRAPVHFKNHIQFCAYHDSMRVDKIQYTSLLCKIKNFRKETERKSYPDCAITYKDLGFVVCAMQSSLGPQMRMTSKI